MRGKGGSRPASPQFSGIPPAYAGKRSSRYSAMHRRWDHPRLCGEKLHLFAADRQVVRITPAYAGKRMEDLQEGNTVQDHPRLCGEKKPVQAELFNFIGSPPPMRGKVAFTSASSSNPRITPAYAGKRPTLETAFDWNGDHPRLCGEKDCLHIVLSMIQGSPPPMRGKDNW